MSHNQEPDSETEPLGERPAGEPAHPPPGREDPFSGEANHDDSGESRKNGREDESNGHGNVPVVTIPGGKGSLAGELIGQHYEILSVAGVGVASTVYRARHLLINKVVAIKLLAKHHLSKPLTVMRFQREAKIASLLDHPYIVKFYEFGMHTTEQPYLILEFVEGKPLSVVVEKDGPLAERRVCLLMLQILEAIGYLHGLSILHRDIKPENVMLVTDPRGSESIKLIDFGFAGRRDRDDEDQVITKTGEVFGTPRYMSPEQQLGKEIDERSDIYSLAALMYFLLVGRAPFQGESRLVTAYQRLNSPPPSVMAVVGEGKRARALDKVIQRGLEVEPEKRYQTIGDFQEALMPLIQDKLAITGANKIVPIGSITAANLPQRRRLNPLLIPSLCMMLFVAVAVYFLASSGRSNISSQPAIESLPEEREELVKIWKKLDIAGQKSFNKGEYEKAQKTFNRALLVARKIGPQCDMVKASLEELVDVSTAARKRPDPQWMPEIEKIGSIEKEFGFKTASDLSEMIDRQLKSSVRSDDAKKQAELTVRRSLNCTQSLIAWKEKDKAGELLKKVNELAACYPDLVRKYQSDLLFLQLSTTTDDTKANRLAEETLLNLEREIAEHEKGPAGKKGELYFKAGQMARTRMDFMKALDYYDKAEIEFQNSVGEMSLECGICLLAQAQLLADMGLRSRAQQKAVLALSVYRSPALSSRPSVRYLTQLADLYSFLGKYDMASTTLAEALDIEQRALPKDYDGICDCLTQIVHVGLQNKNVKGLEPLCQRVIAIRKRNNPKVPAYQSKSIRYLGEIARLNGDRQEAESYYKKALQLDLDSHRRFGNMAAVDDYDFLAAINLTYGTTNGYKQAVDYLNQKIALLEKAYGQQAMIVAGSRMQLADTLIKLEKYDLAEQCLTKVESAVNDKNMSPRELRRIYLLHANVLAKLGRNARSDEYSARAQKVGGKAVELE